MDLVIEIENSYLEQVKHNYISKSKNTSFEDYKGKSLPFLKKEDKLDIEESLTWYYFLRESPELADEEKIKYYVEKAFGDREVKLLLVQLDSIPPYLANVAKDLLSFIGCKFHTTKDTKMLVIYYKEKGYRYLWTDLAHIFWPASKG